MAAAGATAFSCSFASPRRAPRHRRRHTTPRASGAAVEIRVCTNRTCARQGGREVLAALEGLAPPRVDVASCGCLGRCGAGPNIGASVSGGGAAVFGHVGTAARAAQLLEHVLGASGFDAAAGLAALAAREKAEAALEKGDAAEAEALLTEAIEMDSCGGLHLVTEAGLGLDCQWGISLVRLLMPRKQQRLLRNFLRLTCHEGMLCLQWKSTELQRMLMLMPLTLIHPFAGPSR